MECRHYIVVIDDEPDLLDVVAFTLRQYEVGTATNGEEGLALIRRRAPDLVLVDSMMPGMSGLELVRQVKRDVVLRHVPVIMVTAKGRVRDRVEGLQAGADDYVVKPFAPQELLARVQINLRRTERDLDANPLTRMPGNTAIITELDRRLALQQSFAACYADLDRFKAYNDKYGFARGDVVIRDTAQILREVVDDHGQPGDLAGHIGGDDFIVVTSVDAAEGICASTIERFDRHVSSWYDEQDRQAGHIRVVDRRGVREQVPLMSISIGIVRCDRHNLSHPAEIGQIGAELKHYAKTVSHSTFVWDRRGAT